MRVDLPHSHAFPGGRVAVTEDPGHAPAGDALVEFAGGVILPARWTRDGADLLLDIPAHATARGHPMPARRWRLHRRPEGTWRTAPVDAGPDPADRR